jgi:plastocyanin
VETNKRVLLLAGGVLQLTLALTGCGGYSSPSDPDPGTPPGPEGAIVTITSSGLDPSTVTISIGQSVTFVNNDTIAHDMASDPFPMYSDCPAVNRVGRLEPGERTQTGALAVARSCGFHDLLRNGDARWHGTINVQ